ncbi:RNA polymerase recycling motor HelD [Halalkalibacter urbisdiaboli]|uniref:RNA polymerase recycling motor HelD n=1 Tax=Halalkalibacter urbisdiaboli TaxID=1960589 RepID=UPI000B44F434|nr:RNA polymerase recycling motor HelD [Halalkalibacter urbisdiaboli]
MKQTDQVWQKEQERVNIVVEKIKERMNELREKVGVVQEDVVEFRKKFWEDVTVNLENDDEAIETIASIKQQAEVLSERERRHRHDVNQLKSLHRLKETPYFGKITFLEDGEEDAEPVYIGTASFVDNNGFDFYVYDWRAPISSLYYDSGPGSAKYDTPVGEITGAIEEKKQFIIRNAHIEHMFNTGITIGDEMLQEVLGSQANTQMKSIVATIQHEQNQIIRNERARVLIVQGVAGSGKTSAALQRVAYLLYRYRETLQADQIVLFSPNPMFNSYVATVLPELGEENMQQTTFQDYIEHRLGQQFSIEDPFSQMEYVLTKHNSREYESRIEGIELKSSIRYMHLMDDYINVLKKTGMVFKEITFRSQTLFSAETITDWFYSFEKTLSIPNRIQLLVEKLLKEIRIIEKEERKKEWVEREIELLDKDSYLYAFNRVEKQNQDNGDGLYDYEREEEILTAMVVKRHFKHIRRKIKQLRFIDVTKMYIAFLNEHVCQLSDLEKGKEMCSESIRNIEQSQLFFEDVTPILYLKGKIEGFEMNTIIRHVFIDEAQDYSPFQFAFIKHMFPRAKMTVLGDVYQSIYTHSLANDFAFTLNELFKEDDTESYRLAKSYRSTKQIIDFTRQIIGADINPFNRQGRMPVLKKTDSYKDLDEWVPARIDFMREEGHKTIAVICKTAEESQEVFNKLKEQVDARLMTKHSTGYEEGILVIPSYLAKGIEFDTVIVYDASKYRYESERNLFYTICTRAMHVLEVGYVTTTSPFIEGISKETYEEA